jgi:uncharacterized membrane protein YbhN (UPF0104 family)
VLPPRVTRLARTLLPWIVGLALLAWVFWHVPLAGFAEALGTCQLGWLLPTATGTMFGIFLADAFALSRTFTWFTAPLPYREALALRGASYLMSVINYNLGQGMLVLFVNRAKRIPVAVASGAVLLMVGINVVVLLLLSTWGVLATTDPRAATLRPWVLGCLGAFAVYLAVIALRPGFLTRIRLFSPAFSAGVVGHLKAVLVRLPHLGLVFLIHWLIMRAYGIRPPLHSFLTLLPVVSLVSALPISPQGLGTTQVAAVYFFAPYAPGGHATQEATVLAYSLTASVIAILFMLVMGLVFLRRGLSLLGGAQPDAGPRAEASESST